MSEENVVVIRRVFEAFNRRDWEAWESHHYPDAEWHDFAGLPGGGVHRGVGAIRGWIAEFLEIMDGLQSKADEIESLSDDRVLLVTHFEFAGRASGIPVQGPLVQLFDLEDRRVRRVRTFRSSAEALEAAGLGE